MTGDDHNAIVRRLAGICAVLASPACAHAELKYPLDQVAAGRATAHQLKVALLPFTDARSAEDGGDEAEAFTYRGVEYVHTPLAELRGSPLHRITEAVGAHLAKARVFEQVILVLEPTQAPEADLLMRGRVRRMRGYVEAKPPDPKSLRSLDERFVLAEVFFADIELVDARAQGKVLFRVDAGWSIDEARKVARNAPPPDPWAVLGEAFVRAIGDLSAEMIAADLSGRVVIAEEVHLPAGLDLAAPEGWSFVKSSTATVPRGWKSAGGCEESRFQQKQTIRFHRTLGPYRPEVTLWTCPSDQRFSYDPRAEHPARYLGARADGTSIFLHALGQSNWPGAEAELRGHLEVTPPARRHTFEVGP